MMQIQADLLAFLQDCRDGGQFIDAETDLFDRGVLDSLMLLDLILRIQNVHGVTLGASDVTKANFCTVSSLARLVASRADGVEKKAG